MKFNNFYFHPKQTLVYFILYLIYVHKLAHNFIWLASALRKKIITIFLSLPSPNTQLN